MKIVPMNTGATCITLPAKRVIFVDPALNPEQVFQAVQHALPAAHPDAIRHWIEAAMPSTTPLATYRPNTPLPRPEDARRAGLHRAAKTAGRASMRIASLTTAAAFGAAVVVVAQANAVAPVAAAEAWENPVFTRLGTDSNWECVGTDSADLVATCTTPDGVVLHAEAWIGPDSLTFTFGYQTPLGDGSLRQQRNTVMVFSSAGGKQAWLNATPDRRAFPNLVVGERWIMYGTDAPRLKAWAKRLDVNVVLPADVAAAAFQMGLLPSPVQDAGNKREMAHVPEVWRHQATRIILGDPTMPPPRVPAPPGVGPTHPAGGVDFPVPGWPTPAPAPILVPALPAPVPLPTTEPTPPPPTTEPTPPPPTTEPTPPPPPTTEPAPPAAEPTPPPPITEPAPPAAEPTPPPPTTTPDPDDSTLPADGTTPPDETAPGTQPTPTDQPEEPAAEDDVEPEQGPAQPDEPAAEKHDELTGPIVVPDDEPAPLYEEARNTPPIFAALQAERHKAHGHQERRAA